jgi:hypothetical protein
LQARAHDKARSRLCDCARHRGCAGKSHLRDNGTDLVFLCPCTIDDDRLRPADCPSLAATRQGDNFRLTIYGAQHAPNLGLDNARFADHFAKYARYEIILAEKARHELRRWSVIDLMRRANLLDPTAVHHTNPVGHGDGFLLVMCDKKEGRPDLGLDRFQEDLHLAAQGDIKCSQGLVEQNQARSTDDCTCKRDALTLAARELGRIALSKRAELDELECIMHPRRDLGAWRAADDQTITNIALNGKVRKKRVILEHCVERASVDWHRANVAPIEQDFSLGRRRKSADDPQDRGLAGA